MKKLLTSLSLVLLGLAAISCYDDSALWDSLDDHEERISALETACKEMNSNITSIQSLLEASSTGDPITSVTPLKEGDVEVGYTFTFASGKTINVYHGKDGADGEDGAAGAAPQVGIAVEDGVHYWTVNGDWVLDAEGKKVPAYGENGVTPKLKVEDGKWYVSYDAGASWEAIAVAVDAETQDSIFASVTYDDDYVYFTLVTGETITIARSGGLDLIFPGGTDISFFPGESFRIEYKIVGGDENTQIVAMTGNGWVAKVNKVDAASGYLDITAPLQFYDGEVVLLVSDGHDKTIVRTLVFKEGVLLLANSSYEVGCEASTVEISYTTDLNYYIYIDSAYDWITFPSDTKSEMREESFKLNVAENTSNRARFAEVYFVNNNGYIINVVSIYQYGQPYDAWYIAGGFNDWTTGDENYKMVRDGEWFVLKGFTCQDTPLKFNCGSWDDVRSGRFIASDFATLLDSYSDNMNVPAGTYDVYMDVNATCVYFMTPGKTPGDLTETRKFEAGDYWIVAENMVAAPVAETAAYGWLYMAPFVYDDKGLITSDAANVFTFAEAEGGFTIQDSYGRYLYQTGSYNSFNVSYDLPTEGHVWTVAYNEDGTALVTNVAKGKVMQYSYTYASFGAYPEYAEDRILPYLQPAVAPNQPSQPVSGWSVIGAFNDWNGDVWFEADEATGYLVARGIAFEAEQCFKLRKDGTWDVNLGADAAEYPYHVTLGEPVALVANGMDMQVPAAGVYDFYFDESASTVIVVNAGESLGGETVVTATVAEFLAAAEGETWYQLTGKITNLNNTTYGNFDLVDDSGSVYVYGLTATPVEKNDKSFSTLGLKEGDIVTLNGKRASYNGNPQVGGPAYYVSHEAAAEAYSPDGIQWVFDWTPLGTQAIFDFGVTGPGRFYFAYDMGALDESYAGVWYPFYQGSYTVEAVEGTTGVVKLTLEDPYDGTTFDAELPYVMASADSATFDTSAIEDMLEMASVTAVASAEKIVIAVEDSEGLADGEYWIVAEGKVAVPVSGNYGYIQVADAVDGKSTAANAFTFTQVDLGLYTIQDSNGRYYYMTGTYNSFNLSDTDEGTDAYLWEVYNSGNGQYVIMNYDTGKFIQYDPSYNSYGSYSDERGVLPALVLAEDPIAEPEPEEPSGDAAQYATNVTCTTVSSAYVDGVATVNGVADVFTLKLGTSKLYGEATITLPAGTTQVDYYAVGWKGKASKLEFSLADGTVMGTQEIAANEGATGTPPYTITVTDSDHYTFALPAALEAETVVTVKTVETGYRAITFGIQAK